MRAIQTFGNAEQGTQNPDAFYYFFVKPDEIGVFLLRSAFPVEVGKVRYYFDFFRLETRKIARPYEVISMCLMGIIL